MKQKMLRNGKYNVFLMLESVKSDHRHHHKLFSSIKKELRETFSHFVQFIGGPWSPAPLSPLSLGEYHVNICQVKSVISLFDTI